MDNAVVIPTVLKEILDYCDTIDKLIERFGYDEETFLEDAAFKMSCTFALMQIGENVKRIEEWLTSNSGSVRWKAIRRFRCLVAHNYGKADHSMIWKMLTTDYPVLKSEIKRLASEVGSPDSYN